MPGIAAPAERRAANQGRLPMSALLRRLVSRYFAATRRVPTDECVHYGAFRYACGAVNPYEEYALALVRGEPLAPARARFIDFLRHYRPRHLGEALGVTLTREYGLWQLPWVAGAAPPAHGPPGWTEDPDDAPDIITHFSPHGVLRFRVEEEFLWAEKLFYSLRRRGFDPKLAAHPIEACELRADDGAKRYLILDGNHRVSALVARGEKAVTVRFAPLKSVREAALPRWPQVADGTFSAGDARLVFRAYFDGNRRPRTTEVAAPVLETNEQWGPLR